MRLMMQNSNNSGRLSVIIPRCSFVWHRLQSGIVKKLLPFWASPASLMPGRRRMAWCGSVVGFPHRVQGRERIKSR